MRTAIGLTFPITATCGFHRKDRIGRRIATVAGSGSRITAGRGCLTNLGAGRLITTVVGSSMTMIGSGGQGRFTAILRTIQSGRRLTSPSSVLAETDGASDSASETSDGCQ